MKKTRLSNIGQRQVSLIVTVLKFILCIQIIIDKMEICVPKIVLSMVMIPIGEYNANLCLPNGRVRGGLNVNVNLLFSDILPLSE